MEIEKDNKHVSKPVLGAKFALGKNTQECTGTWLKSSPEITVIIRKEHIPPKLPTYEVTLRCNTWNPQDVKINSDNQEYVQAALEFIKNPTF